jgi:hypothetical protein
MTVGLPRLWLNAGEKTRRLPCQDFLYATLDRSACATFFTEGRMRLIDSNKLYRKSGSSMKAAHAAVACVPRTGNLVRRIPAAPVQGEQANARSHLAPSYVQFFSLTRNIMSFILCR